jgi:predicted nucleic-acid-binding protein
MIGLDTNLLLRAFVIEDGDQTRRARAFIARTCSVADPGYINCVVLAEAVWVLGSYYGYGRAAIAGVVARWLTADDVTVERHELVRRALDDFARHAISFSDALIAQINRADGCAATATFDKKAAKLDAFVAVP